MYHYVDSGLDHVYLQNGYDEIGDAISIHNIDELHEVIGRSIVVRATMAGAEFRFLRIELNLSQAHLAQLLGVVESSVRNWEKGRTKTVSEPSARMLKFLYMQSLDKACLLGEMLESISQLNRDIHHLEMHLKETSQGWMKAA